MIASRTCGAWLMAVVIGAASLTSISDADAQTSIVLGGGATEGAEADDLAALNAATEAFQRGGYPALGRHLRPLRRALERAPASYGTIESLSETEWVVRSNDETDALLLSAMASAVSEQQSAGRAVTITAQPNVYPAIALLLGSEAVERHALDEATRYLDRGLAMQPAHAELASEKMAVLQAQGRMADALAIGDAVLAEGGLLPLSAGQGIMQRRRAFSLIELGRLAEAREALNASLEHDPDNAAALNEIRYIDSLESGGRTTAGQAIVPNGN